MFKREFNTLFGITVVVSLIIVGAALLNLSFVTPAVSRSYGYSEVTFTSLSDVLYVNSERTGSVVSVSSVKDNKVSVLKDGATFSRIGQTWIKITLLKQNLPFDSLIITGKKGSIKVTTSSTAAVASDKGKALYPLDELVMSFGRLTATFITNLGTIDNPSGMEISVLNHEKNDFIQGEIIILSNNEAAVEFRNLPMGDVINEGSSRFSLKTPDGGFINADLAAWGYVLAAPEIDIEKPSIITAAIYGLDDNTSVKFTFHPLMSQKIVPPENTLTVLDINAGKPLAEITAEFAGYQPLNVEAQRINGS